MNGPKVCLESDDYRDCYVISIGEVRISLPWELLVQLRRRIDAVSLPYADSPEEQAHRAETYKQVGYPDEAPR